MKVRIEFRKLYDATIDVTLTVAHPGDYPTEYIFLSEKNHPADEGFTLSQGHYDTIKQNAFTGVDALSWAELQKDALACKLEKWRDAYVPPDVEYTI